jgi:hypothetical protein
MGKHHTKICKVYKEFENVLTTNFGLDEPKDNDDFGDDDDVWGFGSEDDAELGDLNDINELESFICCCQKNND